MGVGEGFPADLQRDEDGALGIHPAQLLHDVRGGRRRPHAADRRAGRGPHPHGERLSALRFGVSAHRLDHPRAQGPHAAAEEQDPRGERGAPPQSRVLGRFLVAVIPAVATASFAVEPTPGVAAAASYRGADRTERLITAAKQEGELMLYSSLTQDDQLRLAADFKRRYGVTVKFWRGSQAHILQRVMSETRGGRFEFDVLETNAPQIEALAREKLLQKMNSPHAQEELLPEVMPSHGEWAPDRLNLIVYAYNTNVVKAGEVPRAWSDLLDEKWKRLIGMESTNVEWFAALVESMGEKAGLDLFRRLGDNGVAVRTGHNHGAALVAAGENAPLLGSYRPHPKSLQAEA